MSNDYIKLFRDDLFRLWESMDLPKRFALATLVAITVIAATFFLFKATETNWTVLYSDLSDSDAAVIAESLKKSGYAYKISKEKKAILVPLDIQDELRLYVAENGLIKDSTPGFELLDELQMGATDFKNQLTKQRIYQGELTRSIEKINGIKSARVQIASPERSIFSDKDEAPSASVMLILQPGNRLKTNQIKAIKNLVAYSIPRLTPERVFITDQNGNSLTDEIEKNSSDMESFKYNFENQTSKKVQSVIEKIVGKDNASVQVSAELDFNTTRATIESYVPAPGGENQGVLTTQQTEAETYDNPNVLPNIVDGELASNKNINYQKQKTANTYSVSKEIKQVLYAPGSVKRMTIAVAVNKILTVEEKEELKQLIISASGVNLERGDLVNITSLQFASLAEEKQAKADLAKQFEKEANMDFLYNKALPLGILFILGAGALFIIGSLIRRIAPPASSSMGDLDAYLPPLDDSINLLDGSIQPDEDVDYLSQFEMKVNPEFDKIKHELTDSIMSDPAEATKILMSYIKD